MQDHKAIVLGRLEGPFPGDSGDIPRDPAGRRRHILHRRAHLSPIGHVGPGNAHLLPGFNHAPGCQGVLSRTWVGYLLCIKIQGGALNIDAGRHVHIEAQERRLQGIRQHRSGGRGQGDLQGCSRTVIAACGPHINPGILQDARRHARRGRCRCSRRCGGCGACRCSRRCGRRGACRCARRRGRRGGGGCGRRRQMVGDHQARLGFDGVAAAEGAIPVRAALRPAQLQAEVPSGLPDSGDRGHIPGDPTLGRADLRIGDRIADAGRGVPGNAEFGPVVLCRGGAYADGGYPRA